VGNSAPGERKLRAEEPEDLGRLCRAKSHTSAPRVVRGSRIRESPSKKEKLGEGTRVERSLVCKKTLARGTTTSNQTTGKVMGGRSEKTLKRGPNTFLPAQRGFGAELSAGLLPGDSLRGRAFQMTLASKREPAIREVLKNGSKRFSDVSGQFREKEETSEWAKGNDSGRNVS